MLRNRIAPVLVFALLLAACSGQPKPAASGGPAITTLIPPRGNARKLNSKGGFVAPAGSLVVLEAPGSGGYGDPRERDPTALSEDLLDGYVTLAAARRDYGFGAA